MIGKGLSIPGVMYATEANRLITEAGMILPTLLIYSILIYLNDLSLLKKIALVSLISTLITFIYLIPLIIVNSNILRISLGANFRSMYIGMPTYPAMHSYVIVLPSLLFIFKYAKGWLKYIFLTITGLYLYIIFNASITTTLLIALFIIMFFLLYRNNLKKTMQILGVVVLFVFFLHASDLLINVFDFGVSVTEGTYSQGKFEGFRDAYLTGQKSSSMAERDKLHTISYKSFLKSPLWGLDTKQIDLRNTDADFTIQSSNAVIGGHSSLIDRLGGMGLLGFVPFIMIIVTSVKTWKKFFRSKNAWYFYCVGIGAAGILLYTKGLFGQEGWFTMMVFLPTLTLSRLTYLRRKNISRVLKDIHNDRKLL